jgi:hypothetical protein
MADEHLNESILASINLHLDSGVEEDETPAQKRSYMYLQLLWDEMELLREENVAMRPLIDWLAAELPDYPATIELHEQAQAFIAAHPQAGRAESLANTQPPSETPPKEE